MIARVQGPAIRLAYADQGLLDSHDHALWLLVDRLAWQAEVLPEPPHPSRVGTMQAMANMIGQLASTATQNASVYQWALDTVMASERQRFDQRRQRLISVINELEEMALRSTRPAGLAGTGMQPIDTGQMDTIPSQLLEMSSMNDTRALDGKWIPSLRPGNVVRMYLAGNWVHGQLVWMDPRQEVFLWADCRSDSAWPMRRKALSLLQAEALVSPLEPRSLVKAAARMVASQVARPR